MTFAMLDDTISQDGAIAGIVVAGYNKLNLYILLIITIHYYKNP